MLPGEKLAARKKKPRIIAVIDQNGCTGCTVCLEVCPVNSIRQLDNHPEGHDWSPTGVCEIIYEECIGCKKCVEDCPWDTIEMVDTAEWEKENYQLPA